MICQGFITTEGQEMGCPQVATKLARIGDAQVYAYLCDEHELEFQQAVQKMVEDTVDSPIDMDVVDGILMSHYYWNTL